MAKGLIFPIFVIIYCVLLEVVFRYIKSQRQKFLISICGSLVILFIFYIIAPIKEFFVIPFLAFMLILLDNVNYFSQQNKKDKFYKPQIEELKNKYNSVLRENKEVFEQYSDLEKKLQKVLNAFYLIQDINKNLEVEKIIKDIYDTIKGSYPECIRYISLVKSKRKENIDIIEYPEHREYINKLVPFSMKTNIIVFGEYNVYLFDFSFNDHEIRVIIEYCPMEEDTEFLQFVDFMFSKIKPALKRALLFKEIEEMSRIDGLTSLYLRRYMIKKLQEETIRAYRYNTFYSLIMIDIDFFKKINDTYGHLVGDNVLASLSKLFKDFIGGKGLISRWGGEEFLILLPYTNKKEATEIAEKLRKEVEENEFYFGDNILNITISIGISSFPEDGSDYYQLVNVADEMLYRAKQTGRNKVVSSINLL